MQHAHSLVVCAHSLSSPYCLPARLTKDTPIIPLLCSLKALLFGLVENTSLVRLGLAGTGITAAGARQLLQVSVCDLHSSWLTLPDA